MVSYFSGMLIVAVSAKTGTDRYEDMARKLYNKKVEKTVSILNIICLMGFCMSYIVFVKQTIPFIIH
jgi:amino acid permease